MMLLTQSFDASHCFLAPINFDLSDGLIQLAQGTPRSALSRFSPGFDLGGFSLLTKIRDFVSLSRVSCSWQRQIMG